MSEFRLCLTGSNDCTGAAPCEKCGLALRIVAVEAFRCLDDVLTARVRDKLAVQGLYFTGTLLEEGDLAAYMQFYEGNLVGLQETTKQAIAAATEQRRLVEEEEKKAAQNAARRKRSRSRKRTVKASRSASGPQPNGTHHTRESAPSEIEKQGE